MTQRHVVESISASVRLPVGLVKKTRNISYRLLNHQLPAHHCCLLAVTAKHRVLHLPPTAPSAPTVISTTVRPLQRFFQRVTPLHWLRLWLVRLASTLRGHDHASCLALLEWESSRTTCERRTERGNRRTSLQACTLADVNHALRSPTPGASHLVYPWLAQQHVFAQPPRRSGLVYCTIARGTLPALISVVCWPVCCGSETLGPALLGMHLACCTFVLFRTAGLILDLLSCLTLARGVLCTSIQQFCMPACRRLLPAGTSCL